MRQADRRPATLPVTTPAAARAPHDRAERPFLSLLSDFGERDPSAAICRGVILAIAPDALLVDISHEVAKFAVRDGALLLWCALPYQPPGTHVAVVDPGVGTERRPIALEVGRGDRLVGPDNGLLLPAAERLGGVTRAVVLEAAEYRLPLVSSSFHGRDIFAPAGAHLATGTPLDALGPAIDPAGLVRLPWPEPEVGTGALAAEILYVDTFGNLKLGAEPRHLAAALGELQEDLTLGLSWRGGRATARWAATFGSVEAGRLLVYADAYGRLCLAENLGSAARRLGLSENVRITLRRA